MIGKTFAQYRITKKVGEGGMGQVYLAEDTKLDRKVALKFLPKECTKDGDARERFEREAKAAAALNHPNIVTIYEINEHEDQTYISMEYVEGKTLKDIIQENSTLKTQHSKLASEKIIDYAFQICDGLSAAHKKGIIHRDIKPQNIIINKEGRAKILDFGLAKLKGSVKLTKTSSTAGTTAYLSPESIKGLEVDSRSDIFSFGVVLFEMITGQLPFKGEYEASVIYAVLNEEPEPVQKYRPDLSSEFLHILNRALEKNPEERYQTITDLLIDLKRLKRSFGKGADEIGQKVSASESGAKGFKQKNKKKFVIGLIALSVAILAVLFFFAINLFRSKKPSSTPKENSIAVMYFENRSGEENFEKILSEMLISNLSRCKELKVVSSQHLFDILKRMKIQNAQSISRDTATDIARHASVKVMLVGNIDRIGTVINVNAQLCEVSTGNVIGPAQFTGNRVEDIYDMVNRLTDDTIRLMGISQQQESQPLKINDITTHSYEAYKHYQKGLDQIRRYDFSRASREFRRATEIDERFAMAHAYYAWSSGVFKIQNIFSDLSEEQQSVQTAIKYASGVTLQEQVQIQIVEALLTRDFDNTITLLQRACHNYPQNKEFALWLSYYSFIMGEYQRGILFAQKAIKIDPEYQDAYNFLAYNYLSIGEYQKAITAVKMYMNLMPDIWVSYDSACDVYLKAGMDEEAQRICDRAFQVNPNWTQLIRRQSQIHLFRGEGGMALQKNQLIQKINPELTWQSGYDRGCFNIFEGRYRQAKKEFEKIIQLAELQKNLLRQMKGRLALGRLLGWQGKFSEAVQQFSAVNRLSHKWKGASYNPWPVRTEYYRGMAALRKGDITMCRAAANRIRNHIEKTGLEPILMDLHHLLLAEMNLNQGNPESAKDRFNQMSAALKNTFPRCLLLSADMHFHRGSVPEALRGYLDLWNLWYTSFTGQGGDYFDFFLVQSLLKYKIALSFEKGGEIDQAVGYYQQALKQWKNADPDLPEVRDATARLACLKKVK